jgi:hypothetical protein
MDGRKEGREEKERKEYAVLGCHAIFSWRHCILSQYH